MAKPSVLMAFLAYVILSITSYFLIPFIIDYLHNVINGLFIPQGFFFENGRPRQNLRPLILAQTSFILIEGVGLLFGLYKLNHGVVNTKPPFSPRKGLNALYNNYLHEILCF